MESGSRLGPYEILSRIGAGGMGEVYKARDTRLDRSVAIKILPVQLAANAQLRARFEREAKTISQLDHPNICTLHDVGDNFLVMELLEGETLADRLARGPLPLSEVFRYGAQVADALDRAHRAGVVHRDLKPANVMITRSGAKLLDFGLARSAQIEVASDGETQHKPLTQEGTILGTFQYMAPEQLEGLDADARTDIFALGALLYEMSTGQRAFEGSTRTSLIAAIVSQDPKPLASLQPLTPPAFEHTVSRCLAKQPDDRWQSAHDVAEQLRWISEAGSQAGVAVPVAARKKSRERLAWSLVALLVAALGVAGWAYSRAAREASRRFVWNVTPPEGTRFVAVGDEAGPIVLSPDGTMVAFSATKGGRRQLWVRNVSTGETRMLGGTEDAMYPFWSPDSRHIGFFIIGALKRVDAAGGAPITICQSGPARGGSWGSAGTILFTPDTNNGLFAVPASGGTPKEATKVEPATHSTHRWPWFLPDGKRFLYYAGNHRSPTGPDNGIYLASLDGGAPKLVLKSSANAIWVDGQLFHMRDQTLLAQRMTEDGELRGEPSVVAENVLNDAGIWRGAYTVSETGLLVHHTGKLSILSSLRWFDRTGKELGTVGEPASYWDIDLSPNAERLVLPIGDPGREIWIHDVPRNTRTRFAVDGAWGGSGVFSPDGMTIYFDIARGGKGLIMARRVTGGGEKTIAETHEFGAVRSMSPDGRTLLLDDRRGRVVRVRLDRTGQQEPLSREGVSEAYPTYSPDGKWIAYMSNQNGNMDVFVMSDADPSQKWQISTAGGFFPRWSRDGRELYFLDAINRLVAVPVEESGGDLVIGAATPLFQTAPHPQCRPFDVTPDGRFLVNTMPDQESPNAVAVSHWQRAKR